MPLTQTWVAYKNLTEDLRGQRLELAELLVAEKTRRVEAAFSSDERSVTGRDRDADHAVLDLTIEVLRLKAEIAGNEDLQKLLHDATTAGVELF